jgi:hypothetical protein
MLAFLRDQAGNVLLETTIMLVIMTVFVLGAVDFLNAFYQWNAATKAAEMGARIAATWSPVAVGLNKLCTSASPCSGYNTGDAMPYFKVDCNANGNPGCSCTGACTGIAGFSQSALNAIVYGRGNAACVAAPTDPYYVGMCNMFPRIRPANVHVVYEQTGLGFAGRVTPVPTITVSLQNLQFQFYFLGVPLGKFLGSGSINMPPVTTTITAEDISSCGGTVC